MAPSHPPRRRHAYLLVLCCSRASTASMYVGPMLNGMIGDARLDRRTESTYIYGFRQTKDKVRTKKMPTHNRQEAITVRKTCGEQSAVGYWAHQKQRKGLWAWVPQKYVWNEVEAKNPSFLFLRFLRLFGGPFLSAVPFAGPYRMLFPGEKWIIKLTFSKDSNGGKKRTYKYLYLAGPSDHDDELRQPLCVQASFDCSGMSPVSLKST